MNSLADSLFRRFALGLGLAVAIGAAVHADWDATVLTTLREATSDASQAPRLAAAWKAAADAPLDALPTVLAAFDDASPVAINWLSPLVDRIGEQGDLSRAPAVLDALEAFVRDDGHAVRGRETALELLRGQDEGRATRIANELLDDRAARLRRPAVESLMERAQAASDADEKRRLFERAFDAARDEDQIIQSGVALRDMGVPIDFIRKFGSLMHWQLIGPFAYDNGAGFDTAYPPESMNLDNYDGEQGIFSAHEFDGKEGKLQWRSYANTGRNGVVDLNKAIGELRDAVVYGAVIFEVAEEQEVEIRLRQQNSFKLWLNGELLLAQPVGHTGNFFDQYRVPATMQRGQNLLLIKSCQWAGEASHPFLKNWQIGVRVCDATGGAILAVNRPPTPELDPLPDSKPAED